MGLTTFTAAVLLVAGAFQANAFTLGPAAAAGRNAVTRSSASQVSARGDVFKLNLSPYEEYMKSRGQTVDAPPAEKEESKPAAQSSAPSRPKSSGSKWEPVADWRSKPKSSGSGGGGGSRGGASQPAAWSPPKSAAPAPSPAPEQKQQESGDKHRGVGGMADTRDPEPVNHSDPRKSISAAPSFEEYLKSKKN